MKRRAAALVASFVVTCSAAAESEPAKHPRQTVRMLEPTCGVRLVDLEQYVGVLRVELDAADFPLVDAKSELADAAVATIALEAAPCDAHATSVEVTVTNGSSGQSIRRVVPVWDLEPKARPRAIALATAELLLRAPWRNADAKEATTGPTELSTLATVSPTAPPPAAFPVANADYKSAPATLIDAPTPVWPTRPLAESDAADETAVDARARDTERRPAVGVGGGVEYRAYPLAHTSMLGADVEANVRVDKTHLELGFVGGSRGGSATDPLGTVHLTSTTLGVGLHYVFAASDAQVSVGPTFEGGYGRVSGDPLGNARGGAQGTFVAEGMLDAGVRLEFAPGWWLFLDALGGWSVSGLRGLADDRRVAAMAGAVTALRVGVMGAP